MGRRFEKFKCIADLLLHAQGRKIFGKIPRLKFFVSNYLSQNIAANSNQTAIESRALAP